MAGEMRESGVGRGHRPMTNTRMFLTMLFGAVFRRRGRAAMAVVASMVGAATLFCLAAVCLEVPSQMNEEMRAYGANLVVTPIEQDGRSKAGIEAGMVEHTTEMVTSKTPAKYATYRYENVRVNAGSYLMAGIDPAKVHELNHHWSVEGGWPAKGSVMVGEDIAQTMGLKVGSRVSLSYRASDNNGTQTQTAAGGDDDGQSAADKALSKEAKVKGVDFRVAGIVQTGGSEDEIIYGTLADLEGLTGTRRGADVIEYSSSAMGNDLTAIARSINEMTSMGVKARTVTKITSADTHTIAMLQTLFWLVSVVVLVLTFVGVGTTMTSIVSQRRSEIGLRKALGASSRGIGTEFYAESALYGLAGGLVGTALGYLFARLLCQTVFERSLEFNWWLALASVLLSVLISVAASIRPVRRASRIDPALVLREE